MYHDKARAARSAVLLRVLGVLACLLAVLGGVHSVLLHTRADLDAQAAETLRRSVVNAAVQCYAVEGAYPESLAKLEEEYGVQINRSKFVVSYTVFASNVLPEVAVLQKP